MRIITSFAALLLAAQCAGAALGQNYPSRPEYQMRLAGMGAVVEGGGSDRLAARVRQELYDWAEVIRNANVTATAD